MIVKNKDRKDQTIVIPCNNDTKFLNVGFVLMPGQIFPLTLFHPSDISPMRTLINSTKTFGVITMGIDPSKCGGEIGTTAEVFEYQDVEDENSVGFKIKARGRQRFKLVSARRQINGTLEGSVIMISDNPLPNPLGMLRFFFVIYLDLSIYFKIVNPIV